MNKKIYVSRNVKFDELSCYNEFINLNNNEKTQDEYWSKKDDDLFNDIIWNKNAEEEKVMLRGSLKDSSEKSRYSTSISENLPDNSTLVKALQNSEEEEKNEKFNLLHIFKSLKHVVSQKITMFSIQSLIHVSIT